MNGDAKLAGRVAIVTGGGGAIGGAIAKLFATEGASVVAADINLAAAEATAAAITGAGGQAAGCELDVSQPVEAEAAVQFAISRFESLHILVNVAAAVTPDGTVVELDFEDWNKALAVNLGGPFLMCKYAIPHIKAAGGGAIVNIASQLGQLGVPKRAPYCTSKAALIHFSKIMAMDHAKDNIRVNSLSPGAIDTPRSLHRYGTQEESRRVRGPLYMPGRIGTVDEIAKGALFLASDDSTFMTAADLLIDGGYVAFKTPLDR